MTFTSYLVLYFVFIITGLNVGHGFEWKGNLTYYTVWNTGEIGDMKTQVSWVNKAPDSWVLNKKIFPGENFLEENITEAFNIVDTCRKALEDVKEAWEKANKVMDPEIATSITRKLRKIYAINKISMDQVKQVLTRKELYTVENRLPNMLGLQMV